VSWNPSTDDGGSGLKAYIITRSDGFKIPIGAIRTSFSDTTNVKSATSLSYTIAAQDNSGNKSASSSSVSVVTPVCPSSGNEQVVDSAYLQPLGKSIANYGQRSVLIYTKQNASLNLDTWLSVNDANTGQVSRVLLHGSPSYHQIESDYILASETDLWTLSYDSFAGGHLLVSQYKLIGSPVSSVSLVSTKSLGDSHSYGRDLIRLQSGAIVAAWNEEGYGYSLPDGSIDNGYAYRSPAGIWNVQFPVNIPNPYGGNLTKTQIVMAQHPADQSIWSFAKRDSFGNINALHFTETSNGLQLDWINTGYITSAVDSTNSPQSEYPFLAAAVDTTRNAILLGYQTNQSNTLFVDPLFNNGNAIFLKEAKATIAAVTADGSKSFVPYPNAMERDAQFGLSVQSDGTIWLTYQPINHQSLTWNEVYTSQYTNGSWSSPVLVGFDYNNYGTETNTAAGARDPGFMVYRADQPQVAFLTPDQKVHSFTLSDSAPAQSNPDTIAPTTSITNPVNGSTVTGTVSVTTSASDNVGIVNVELLLDGNVIGNSTSSPWTFSWNSTSTPDGTHSLQTRAYDSAGNTGLSSVVSVNASNTAPMSSLTVAITNPGNGAKVPRNQKVNINATATDNVGVLRMQFLVNKKQLCSLTTAPYACLWKVPAKMGVVYNIQAIATDATGTTASQIITVTAQ
jgi:hypothetical protein